MPHIQWGNEAHRAYSQPMEDSQAQDTSSYREHLAMGSHLLGNPSDAGVVVLMPTIAFAGNRSTLLSHQFNPGFDLSIGSLI